MLTKYGYSIKSNAGVTIEEVWGFDSLEDAAKSYDLIYRIIPLDSEVNFYRTTHRNYFGKQFKQISCEVC